MTLTLKPAGTLTFLPNPHTADVPDDGELWYRDNDTNPLWEPLDTLREARSTVSDLVEPEPMGSHCRFSDINDDNDVGRVTMLEVLGWGDRVWVCGGVSASAPNDGGAAGRSPHWTDPELLRRSDRPGIKPGARLSLAPARQGT